MGWYKLSKLDRSAEIRALEIQIKSLEDKKAFMPKQLAALKAELDTIPRQIDALKAQVRSIKQQ